MLSIELQERAYRRYSSTRKVKGSKEPKKTPGVVKPLYLPVHPSMLSTSVIDGWSDATQDQFAST